VLEESVFSSLLPLVSLPDKKNDLESRSSYRGHPIMQYIDKNRHLDFGQRNIRADAVLSFSARRKLDIRAPFCGI